MVAASLAAPEVQAAFEGILAREAKSTEEPTPKVAKATKPEVEAPEPEADEAPVEATEEAASETPEVEVEGEETVEDVEAASAEDAPIEMFADLAKGLGRTEAEALAAIKIPGLDGKPVPLADVVKAYRDYAQTGVLREQLDAKAQEFDGKIQQFEQQRDVAFGQIQALSQQLLEKVEADRKFDWEKLKVDDPQQYLLKKAEAQDRAQTLQLAIQAQWQEKARLDSTQNEQREKWKLDEGRKIASAHPEWVGTSAGRDALAEVTGRLDAAGLKPQEVGDFIPDHRVFEIVWESAQYRKLQAKGPLTLKALKSVPKVVGPQGRPPVRDAKIEKMKTLRRELQKNGDINSAARFFEETMS
jgi:hypothetical protein